MKDYLHIYDLGSYVHGGLVNRYAYFVGPVVGDAVKGWSSCDLEAGPVASVFKSIKEFKDDSDFVFCSDRNPTIKKGYFPGYKYSRQHSDRINTARTVLEKCLEFCGYDVYYDDGYEADDFVYELARKFRDKYRHVYIHTGDADLYTCVCKNVSIAKTLSNTKEVTLSNYYKCCEKGVNMVYNANTIHKMINGCKSDEIPPLESIYADKLVTFLQNFPNKEMWGDRDFIMQIFAWNDVIQDRARLVFPLAVEVSDTVNDGDFMRVVAIGQLAHSNAFKNLSVDGSTSLKAESFISNLCKEVYDGKCRV